MKFINKLIDKYNEYKNRQYYAGCYMLYLDTQLITIDYFIFDSKKIDNEKDLKENIIPKYKDMLMKKKYNFLIEGDINIDAFKMTLLYSNIYDKECQYYEIKSDVKLYTEEKRKYRKYMFIDDKRQYLCIYENEKEECENYISNKSENLCEKHYNLLKSWNEKNRKIKILKKTRQCSICLDNVKEDYYKTKCRHYFHYKCLKEWKEYGDRYNKKSCPCCRSEI